MLGRSTNDIEHKPYRLANGEESNEHIVFVLIGNESFINDDIRVLETANLEQTEHLLRGKRERGPFFGLQDETPHISKEGMCHGPFRVPGVMEVGDGTTCRMPLPEREKEAKFRAQDTQGSQQTLS